MDNLIILRQKQLSLRETVQIITYEYDLKLKPLAI